MSTCLQFISIGRGTCLLTMVFCLTVLSGCYNQPVRHLTSDIGLVKVGESSRREVMAILGEPDAVRKVSATSEEWIYSEEDKSLLQRAPGVGGLFAPTGYKTVVLTLEGDIVTASRYEAYNKDELDWQDDYIWQDVEPKTENKD